MKNILLVVGLISALSLNALPIHHPCHPIHVAARAARHNRMRMAARRPLPPPRPHYGPLRPVYRPVIPVWMWPVLIHHPTVIQTTVVQPEIVIQQTSTNAVQIISQ